MKNKIYYRGPKFEADFRHTTFFKPRPPQTGHPTQPLADPITACSPQGQGCTGGEGASEAAPERLDRRLEEVAEVVGGGACRL